MADKANIEKNPPGHPPFRPNAEQRRMVEAMSSCGVTQAEIATVLDINERTLRKYFREELDKATAKANTKVALNLFKQATKDEQGSTTAAIFWLKTRAGWKDQREINVTGTVNVNIKQMTDDQLEKYILDLEAETIEETETLAIDGRSD